MVDPELESLLTGPSFRDLLQKEILDRSRSAAPSGSESLSSNRRSSISVQKDNLGRVADEGVQSGVECAVSAALTGAA